MTEEIKDIQPVSITGEIRKSFLEYAMSVIVSRALPDVRDGLKPVHRRIIYAMNEQGLHSDKPYKKSARIVGDVLGKYHPHGDLAVYDTLVRLAQEFSMRYMLVDGHGNFGSVDGDAPAAMRYTESRMSKIAMEMVRDINKETVDFMDNYDGEEKEPVVLPARFPNLLVNGSAGIAVGMATNIPPHHLGEVIDAVLALAKNPELTINDLMNYIPGPDFPTGAIILRRSGIRKAYETGNGSFIIRSRTQIEELDNGKKRIIVTEIPYQVNKANLVERIADLVRTKTLEGITDLRDESNREGNRIVIDVRKDIIPEVLLNHLFKLTPLQVSYSINMIALVNGEPRTLNIKQVLQHYLNHQIEVLTRRTQFELSRAEERLHILDGLLVVTKNIDEVVQIIRQSADGEKAQAALQSRFGLTERQAKAILDMKLGRLTGIEQDKIIEESTQLRTTVNQLKFLLSNQPALLQEIEKELMEIKLKFADHRRSEISADSEDIEDEDLIPQEDIVISLTTNGYIKRVSTATYRTQNRGGRGITGMTTNEDDVVDQLLITNTHRDILFFSNFGRVYRIRGHRVPEYARQAKGIPAINLLSLEKTEVIKAMISVESYTDLTHSLVFVTKNGIVKRTSLQEFEQIRQNGKIAISMREDDQLVAVKLTSGNDEILIASSQGRVVRFSEQETRQLSRSAIGVRGIDVEGGRVIGVSTTQEGQYIFTITEKGLGKMTELDKYRITRRNAKGVKTFQQTEKTGELVAMRAVRGDEDLLVITDKGVIIRISLSNVRVTGRVAQGVWIIKPEDGHAVSSIAVLNPETNSQEVTDTPTSV